MIQYPILAYFSLFSPVLPIFVGIYRLKTLSNEMRILVLYLIVAFTIDNITFWVIKTSWLNLGLWHTYVLIEFLFVMLIIYSRQESRKMINVSRIIIGLYVIFWFCAKFTFEPLNGLYSVTASVSQVILALSAGYMLFIVIGNRPQSLLDHQRFWILLSFVFYYTGTLMPIALAGVLFNQLGEAMISLGFINWFLAFFSNILFTIGFLCPQTRPS